MHSTTGRRNPAAPPPTPPSPGTYRGPPWSGAGGEVAARRPSHPRCGGAAQSLPRPLPRPRPSAPSRLVPAPPRRRPARPGRALGTGGGGGPRRPLQSRAQGGSRAAFGSPSAPRYAAGLSPATGGKCPFPTGSAHILHRRARKRRYNEERSLRR